MLENVIDERGEEFVRIFLVSSSYLSLVDWLIEASEIDKMLSTWLWLLDCLQLFFLSYGEPEVTNITMHFGWLNVFVTNCVPSYTLVQSAVHDFTHLFRRFFPHFSLLDETSRRFYFFLVVGDLKKVVFFTQKSDIAQQATQSFPFWRKMDRKFIWPFPDSPGKLWNTGSGLIIGVVAAVSKLALGRKTGRRVCRFLVVLIVDYEQPFCWHFLALNKVKIHGHERFLDALDNREPGRGLITISNHYCCADDPLLWGRKDAICLQIFSWHLYM